MTLISLVEERSRVVGMDLEEVNGHFDHHRGKINRLKKREEELKGLIIGAGHEAQVFKNQLDLMERACKCGHAPSEVEEELSSEEDARTKLSYASARASKYMAPLVENPIPIPIPAPCHPCSSSMVCPALEEIVEKPGMPFVMTWMSC